MTDSTSGGSPPAPPATSAYPSPLEQFDDPCAAYKRLMEIKTNLVSGQGVAEYEYHGNGTMKRVKYSLANMTALDTMIRAAQAECAKSIGAPNPGRRFALTAQERPRMIPGARWSARYGYY